MFIYCLNKILQIKDIILIYSVKEAINIKKLSNKSISNRVPLIFILFMTEHLDFSLLLSPPNHCSLLYSIALKNSEIYYEP